LLFVYWCIGYLSFLSSRAAAHTQKLIPLPPLRFCHYYFIFKRH